MTRRSIFAIGALMAAACGSPAATSMHEESTAVEAAGRPSLDGRAISAVDPPTSTGSMAPSLARGESDEAILTWIEPGVPSGHRVKMSRLSGLRWSAPTTVVESDRMFANWADVPLLVREADGGALILSWAEKSGPATYAYDVRLARSADRGTTWVDLGRAHDDGTETEHGFVSFAADASQLFAFWLDGRETAREEAMTLRAGRVGPGASGVTHGEVIDRRVCDCCPTAAAMTERGPVVAYRDRDEHDVRDISIVRWVRGRWSAPTAVHRDGWTIEGCPVNGPAIAADRSLVAVAWYTGAAGRPAVKVAFSGDAGAHFGAPTTVDEPEAARQPIGRVGVVFDDAGDALVGWVAATGDTAQFLLRRVAADGRLGPEQAISDISPKRAGGVPRMVRIGDSLIVAWTARAGDTTRVRAATVNVRAIGAVAARPGRARAPAVDIGSSAVAGRPAPDYAATTLDGRPARLTDLRGKVVLLNLWATWCAPCLEELPALASLHGAYAHRGVAFIAASVDAADARDQVLAAVKRRRMPFAVWLDPDDRASALFAARSLPVTLVIGKNGTIAYRRDGTIKAKDAEFIAALEAALEP